MDDFATGQVTESAADVYERFFVPALFREWAAPVADAAGIAPGHHVIDVACGTGVLTREAARRAGSQGRVVGLDCNEGMLRVARRAAPEIDWRQGRAESLPFPDHGFDIVVSQFGLMFFDDRRAAIGEMWRVLRPGGRLAVAVWDQLDQSPGYAALTALLLRLFGEKAADALRAPFLLGERDGLARLFEEAGAPSVEIATREGSARFPSMEAWMHTEIRGWTLADQIDDAQYETLRREASRELAGFEQDDGTVALRCPAHIATATKA